MEAGACKNLKNVFRGNPSKIFETKNSFLVK